MLNIKDLSKKQKIIICACAAAIAVIAAIITVIIIVHTVKNPPSVIINSNSTSNMQTSNFSQFENSSDIFVPDASITVTPEGVDKNVEEIIEAVDKVEQDTQNTVVVKDNTIDASGLSKRQVKLNVKYVPQNPELPTGCEITALTTVLNYYGYNVSKTEMADNYLEKTVDRVGDFWEVFVGNPRKNGFGCYAKPIVKAANKYLATQDSAYIAENYSGTEFENLLKFVENGTPVIIWSTMYGSKTHNLLEPYTTVKWNINGKTVQWIAPEHCMVLIGYDIDRNIAVMSDPQRGIREYNLETVKARYLAMHSQCVILTEQLPTIQGVENGATYYTTQYVSISSNNVASVTVNGNASEKSFYINGNANNMYIIEATSTNGSSVKYTIYTKSIDSLLQELNGLNKLSVTEDDTATINNVKKVISKTSTAYATTTEIKELDSALKICDDLLDRISEVKFEITRITKLAEKYETEEPSSDDGSLITDLLVDIDALLATENLTNAKRSELETLKIKCSDWLSNIYPEQPPEATKE